MNKDEKLEEVLNGIELCDENFDRHNPDDLDKVAKSIVLSEQERGNTEPKEKYMERCVDPIETIRMNKRIKILGKEAIKIELAMLNLEKEIIEKKIEVVKRFMN